MRATYLLCALILSLASLAGAFFFQYAMAILPCHLCLLQRYPHAILIVLAIIALIWRNRGVPVIGALISVYSIGLAIYHSGVERHFWAGPSDCTGGQNLAGLSGSDLLSTNISVGVIQCDKISYEILHLSFANWNILISVFLLLMWINAARRS